MRAGWLIGGLLASGCASAPIWEAPAWLAEARQAVVRGDPDRGGLTVTIQCEGGTRIVLAPAHLAVSLGLSPLAISDQTDLAWLSGPQARESLRVGDDPHVGDLVWVVHAPRGRDRWVGWGRVASEELFRGRLPLQFGSYAGSSGGVVLGSDGRLVGLVVGMEVGIELGFPVLVPQTAWMIPASTIRQFLSTALPGCLEGG